MGYIITALIAGVVIAALTIFIGLQKDAKYGSSTKSNLTRLTAIYVALIVFCLIGLGLYIGNL
ncbi:hypothetical protein QUF84_10075 [Fictibacillus enclensis]|uniref:hypothetical protein n=1 Tax=Fictibacillus enclensis TaxID=1017270 RepID=UPI0025A045AE|nr:hypothetical protein [Fictibacillus enclensis]MDM5198362.1 hypothetical protein [Fictibacillus enclensis]MDM5337563.1 hypothetical protein [Fictibacillus enclensis]